MTKKSTTSRPSAPRKLKVGEDLEMLVAWVHECLHDRATIRHNVRLWSKSSKSFRQVDIEIRVADGPLEFLTIVEVKDKSRPAEPNHIGALEQTRIAVGAQRAIYVSKRGFSASAVELAKSLGIQTFSFIEAKSGDWNGWFQSALHVQRHLRSRNDITLTLLLDDDRQLFNIDTNIVERIRSNGNSPNLENAEGVCIVSMSDLVSRVRSSCEAEILAQIPTDGRHALVKVEHLFPDSAPKLWMRISDSERVRVRGVVFEDEFWFDIKNCPVSLSQYSDDSTETQLGENLRLVANLPNDLSFRIDIFHSEQAGDGKVHIRPSIVRP